MPERSVAQDGSRRKADRNPLQADFGADQRTLYAIRNRRNSALYASRQEWENRFPQRTASQREGPDRRRNR